MSSYTDQVFTHFAGGGSQSIPIWKRGLDLTCILLALLLLAPLFVLIGLYIKMVSPGPVFFRQERIGYRGRSFLCYKFRTMKHGADTGIHHNHVNELMRSNRPMTKMDCAKDPRLIPLGRLLRSSGLDELPQLVNVVRGEMSLVGPRPCTPYEYAEYRTWQIERFSVLPGLTGLWQVSGKNRTTFTEMVNLDINYARNISPWLDFLIMLKTFPVLIGQVMEMLGKMASLPTSDPKTLIRRPKGL